MVNQRTMLGRAVAFVSVARLPAVAKLERLDLVALPMEPHIYGLNAAGGTVIVDDAECRDVVGLYW